VLLFLEEVPLEQRSAAAERFAPDDNRPHQGAASVPRLEDARGTLPRQQRRV